MKIILKPAITVTILFVAVLFVYGQEKIPVDLFKNHSYTSEWNTCYVNDYISVAYKYIDCSDIQNGVFPEYLILNVKNLTNHKIYLFWDYFLMYSNNMIVENSEGSVENSVQLFIEPNDEVSGNCNNSSELNLRIFVQFKDDFDNTCLTDFRFDNLNTYKLDQ